MAALPSEAQVAEAMLASEGAMAAAGHAYHNPDYAKDLRDALFGHMSMDDVVRRGAERIQKS
jgi:hypothetical protein